MSIICIMSIQDIFLTIKNAVLVVDAVLLKHYVQLGAVLVEML